MLTLRARTTCSRTLWLLDNSQAIGELSSSRSHSRDLHTTVVRHGRHSISFVQNATTRSVINSPISLFVRCCDLNCLQQSALFLDESASPNTIPDTQSHGNRCLKATIGRERVILTCWSNLKSSNCECPRTSQVQRHPSHWGIPVGC